MKHQEGARKHPFVYVGFKEQGGSRVLKSDYFWGKLKQESQLGDKALSCPYGPMKTSLDVSSCLLGDTSQ